MRFCEPIYLYVLIVCRVYNINEGLGRDRTKSTFHFDESRIENAFLTRDSVGRTDGMENRSSSSSREKGFATRRHPPFPRTDEMVKFLKVRTTDD